jgi:microcystin-dependent protein
MADPFVAEIRIVPFNFAPKGWAFCDGQILPLSQNTALFALLGTTYGGDGKSNFALPDLQGRAPMHHGQGPGLSNRDLGESGGAPYVTLLTSEIPAHTHTASGSSGEPFSNSPANGAWATLENGNAYRRQNIDTTMSPNALAIAGGSRPHNNMPPYLTFYFIIALQGVFPQRS